MMELVMNIYKNYGRILLDHVKSLLEGELISHVFE